MAGTRPFLGTEISLDEIDYTVSTQSFTWFFWPLTFEPKAKKDIPKGFKGTKAGEMSDPIISERVSPELIRNFE